MVHHAKYLTVVSMVKAIFQRQSLIQQLRTKYSHRYNIRDEDGEWIERRRSKTQKPEGQIHLCKSMGQHILTNPRVLDAIVRKSDIKPTDTVLEIGPGTGNLTLKLLEVAHKVVAVEIDKRMVEILCKRVAEVGFGDRFTIIHKDALKTEFPRFDLVVANIPYGISSCIVSKLVFGTNPFRNATLLLQEEFAKRLLAKPGEPDFNRLAVNVKLVAEVEFVMDVSKRDFVPMPRVDSSVIKIRPKAEIPDVDLEEWRAFTRTCFIKKNKTLAATLKQKRKLMELSKLSKRTALDEENLANSKNFICSDHEDEAEDNVSDGDFSSWSGSESKISLLRERIMGVLKAGGFEDKRPSKLSHEELLHLLSSFNQAGIFFHDRSNKAESDDMNES